MNAAKKGYVAEFKTGYLQIEVRKELKVADGTDRGLRDPFAVGIASGRLAKIVGGYLKPVAGNNIADADYIVAQSDDTVIDLPKDISYPERYSTLPNLIVKNSEDIKTVALYKIVDKEDIKLRKIAEPVDVKTCSISGATVTPTPMTYQFIETGINTYKVIGSVPKYEAGVAGNPAGNVLTFTMKNADITNKSQLPDGDIYNRYSNEPSLPHNSATKEDFESDGSVACGVWVNNETKQFTITVEWIEGEVSTYTFDLTDAVMGE